MVPSPLLLANTCHPEPQLVFTPARSLPQVARDNV
jgi:hypothetical protein